MIYETGFQKPTAKQKQIAIKRADASFTEGVPWDFGDLPTGSKWLATTDTGILLKMRNVEPHVDPWLSSAREPAERKRSALFWVIDLPSFERIHFQCGGQKASLRRGDYVVFNDSIMHCVVAERVWKGCAYQLLNKPK